MSTCRFHMTLEPEVFMGGLRLTFGLQMGGKRITVARQIHMADLFAEDLLDYVWRECRGQLQEAIKEHQRDCASAMPIGC